MGLPRCPAPTHRRRPGLELCRSAGGLAALLTELVESSEGGRPRGRPSSQQSCGPATRNRVAGGAAVDGRQARGRTGGTGWQTGPGWSHRLSLRLEEIERLQSESCSVSRSLHLGII